jgi:hypothetical protein
MFYIDFWGFSNDPLYLGYNSAEQENPVLCIFNFQGPSRTQKDLGFFLEQFFIKTKAWSTWTSRGASRGPKEHQWRGPVGGPRHLPPFGRRISDCLVFRATAFVLT